MTVKAVKYCPQGASRVSRETFLKILEHLWAKKWLNSVFLGSFRGFKAGKKAVENSKKRTPRKNSAKCFTLL